MNPLLRVRDLRFSYSGRAGHPGNTGEPLLAVDRLEVRSGEIVVLTGENGCGKTTLLKLSAGLLVPRSGSVETGARPILVHQRPCLFAASLFANVAWPLRIRHLPREEIRRRTATALDRVGLAQLERRWAPALSGGEKQRAAIARALVLDPELLLLDEPTANIDPASVPLVEELLRSVASAGAAVVLTTHHTATAYRLADSLLPMRGGRLEPASVNVLPGRLDTAEEGIGRFQVDEGPRIFCPAARGDFTRAVVPMDDILLSAEPVATSAQNRFPATVRALEPVRDGLERVDLDVAARCRLSSFVTHRSVGELGLAPGATVWVTFKASAVGLY